MGDAWAASPRRDRLAAIALGTLASGLAYGLLPGLAPKALGDQVTLLLLGVLLGVVSGVAVRLPRAAAPAMGAAAAVALTARYTLAGIPWLPVFLVAVLIGAEIAVLPWLWRRGRATSLARPRDMAVFFFASVGAALASGLLAATVSATAGVPVDDFFHTFRAWVLDDVFGLLVIAPAFMVIARPRDWAWPRALEFVGAAALSLGSVLYIFLTANVAGPGWFGWPYLVIVGPIWAAARLGVRGATPILAVSFWLMVYATTSGNGPFVRASTDPVEQLGVAQLFAIVMSATVLAIAVLRDDRLRSAARLAESGRFVRQIVDGSESAIFAKSYEGEDAGTYVLSNNAAARIAGRDPEDVLGRTDAELFPPELAESLRSSDLAVMSTRSAVTGQQVLPGPDGAPRVYSSSTFPLVHEDGTVWGVAGMGTDITALTEAREHDARQARLLRLVFELSPMPATRLVLRDDGVVEVVAANAAMCRLMGAPLVSLDGTDLQLRIHPGDRDDARRLLEQAKLGVRRDGGMRQREMRMQTLDGRTVWVLVSAGALGEPDAAPGQAVVEWVVQFEDFTARRDAERALSRMALRDTVTGLPNRRALQERMHIALTRLRRNPALVTLLFCDLDQFKDVNDSLGHQVGDDFLREVAHRMLATMRSEDTVARLGGDEFVVLAEGVTDETQATVIAQRLQARLAEPWQHDHQLFRPTMSIGIAMTGDSEVSADELLRRADLAMYRAKANGRDRVELYDRTHDEAMQRAVAIQQQLREALDAGTLVLAFQPIVRLDNGAFTGAEALVRMPASDGQLMAPG
ncbi:MAG: diguanylate cyclase, partial [Actinomycetota bacterium]|nr:diguanylate cyclase [Actinomycetota bacterium]